MPTYCGVDFHARQQSVTYCSSEDGEVRHLELRHQDQSVVREFYAGLPGPVIVGFETSPYSQWFEDLLDTLGCEVWIGDPKKIRAKATSRHKNDRRDATLIFDLMVRNDFPRIFRFSLESREVLQMLRYRRKLVKIRTIARNRLHAISIAGGLSLESRLLSKQGLARLNALSLRPNLDTERGDWLQTIEEVNRRISRIDRELELRAEADERVKLVRTHPGIGPQTSLALVHTLWPVKRFSSTRHVASYVGLVPRDKSTGGKVTLGPITKAGSRILRYLLGEAALTAVREEQSLRKSYNNICRRRGSQKATSAIARKLLIRGFILLRDGIDFDEFQRRAVAARPARNCTKP